MEKQYITIVKEGVNAPLFATEKKSTPNIRYMGVYYKRPKLCQLSKLQWRLPHFTISLDIHRYSTSYM